jgi:hypothetical protein
MELVPLVYCCTPFCQYYYFRKYKKIRPSNVFDDKMVVIANGHISLKKIDWYQIFCAYFIISRDASLETIVKGQSFLFVFVIYFFPKYTVESKFSSAFTQGLSFKSYPPILNLV